MKKMILLAIPLASIGYFGTYALLRSLPNTPFVLFSAIAVGIAFILAPAWFGFRAEVRELPGHARSIQHDRIRALEWRLVLSTFAALGTFPLVYVWEKDMLIVWGWPLAMFLWTFCGVPLLRAKNPDRYDPLFPSAADREARLAPRKGGYPIPVLAWAGAWGVVTLFCLVTLAYYLRAGYTDELERALASLIVVAPLLLAGPYFSRWWMGRPEPMRLAKRDALEIQYARLRKIKDWWVYAFCLSNTFFVFSQGLAFLIYGLELGSRSMIGTIMLLFVFLTNSFFGLIYAAQLQRISVTLKEECTNESFQ